MRIATDMRQIGFRPSVGNQRVGNPRLCRTRAIFSGWAAFTLVEMLVVIAIIGILMSLTLPAVMRSKGAAQGTVCKSNMKQIMLGIMMYTEDNTDHFPWAGGVDRDWSADWMFGGQDREFTNQRRLWAKPPPDFGFHAEAGSIFNYVTGNPIHRLPGGLVDLTASEIYPVYRCPSTGLIGRALRVNYSLNAYIDADEHPPLGVRASWVKNPSGKILLVNEDPHTMHNASFNPTGSATRGDNALHNGSMNLGFVDGHIEGMTDRRLHEIMSDTNKLRLEYFVPYWPPNP